MLPIDSLYRGRQINPDGIALEDDSTQLTYRELVERVEALAAMSLNEHCAMIEKLDAEDVMKSALPKESIGNLANYFISLPSEAAMKLWNVISQGGVQENVVKFHRANDGAVGSHLSKILGA